MISGFLITTLLIRERRSTGGISLRKFYARRSLRIFPLYFAVLGLYVVLVSAVGRNTPAGQTFFSNLPYFLTYTSNWFVGAASVTFGFAWSLAAEEQFYCVWPQVEKFCSSKAAVRIAWITALVATIVSALPWILGSRNMEHSLLYAIPARIPVSICLGVMVAHLLDDERGFQWAWRIAGSRMVTLVSLSAVVAAAASHSRVVVAIPMAALVCAAVIREDHGLARLLEWKPLAYIGMISYGMYLLHGLAYQMVHRFHLPGLVEFPIALAGGIAIASISYRYFEGPLLKLKQRFTAV